MSDILTMSKASEFLGFKQRQREQAIELHHLALL